MDMSPARHTFMSKKNGDSVSPYLRKPLRKYEEATREQAKDEKRSDRGEMPTKSLPRDPVDKVSPDESNDR